MFPALIDAGRREDIWCAFDSEGQILGATIAAIAHPDSPVHRNLAWPAMIGELPSQPSTDLRQVLRSNCLRRSSEQRTKHRNRPRDDDDRSQASS